MDTHANDLHVSSCGGLDMAGHERFTFHTRSPSSQLRRHRGESGCLNIIACIFLKIGEVCKLIVQIFGHGNDHCEMTCHSNEMLQ